jgi:hypothetical protein
MSLSEIGREAEQDAPGQEIRRLAPWRLSRCRSRVAMRQVRSMHTATAQDIGPPWPC